MRLRESRGGFAPTKIRLKTNEPNFSTPKWARIKRSGKIKGECGLQLALLEKFPPWQAGRQTKGVRSRVYSVLFSSLHKSGGDVIGDLGKGIVARQGARGGCWRMHSLPADSATEAHAASDLCSRTAHVRPAGCLHAESARRTPSAARLE